MKNEKIVMLVAISSLKIFLRKGITKLRPDSVDIKTDHPYVVASIRILGFGQWEM